VPRRYLDPKSLGTPAAQIEVERLPKRVRDFRHYPDIGLLQPGDLILVSPVVKKGNAQLIEGVQANRHDPFDAQWIHAATYLRDNSLVEIDQSGVGVDDLHKYVPTHRLLFRRALGLDGKPVGEAMGFRIAIAALKSFKTKYAFPDLVRIYVQTRRWAEPDYRFRLRTSEAICSDFYNDAVAGVLGRGAASAKRNPFTPADLAVSKNMEDIDARWATLP